MDAVHFLNIEYFLLVVYRLFTGTNVDISQIPTQTLLFMEYVTWSGLIFTVLLGFTAAYLYNKLHEIEHAGWHKRDHEIHELEKHHAMKSAKNPQWEHVKSLAASENESDWRRAIIEADIMLDQLLTNRGYSGQNLGDKLKSANPLQFTTLDLAWKAHKVRNDIAHGGEGYRLTDRDTKATLDYYRRVFEEFDYI